MLLCSLFSSAAFAQAMPDRFSASGYFRLAARPDFQGGNGKLGFSDLYGRLLNEGPYAMLELKLDVLQAPPDSTDVWASVHARVEGGSVGSTDSGNGSLANFRLSQLYVRAGNLLFEHVTWQVGTLYYYFGDLGLYDLRPANIFDDTIGISARYSGKNVDVMIGLGDSGFAIRGLNYSPMATIGGMVRAHFSKYFEIGGGGQVAYEPSIPGDRYSPYQTPGATYEQYLRHEVVLDFLQANPGEQDFFPKPVAASQPTMPWRLVGYLGFGNLGPLRWNNFFISYRRLPTDQFYTETQMGTDFNIYVADFTRDRYQLQLGNEMQLKLIPNRLDVVWGVLYGNDTDLADTLSASERNRIYYSTVVRFQLYLTKTLHFLFETSLAQEKSKNGNLWREHVDSVFQSTDGVSDTRGLQYGDLATRNTVQLKGGFVLNPTGFGVYARPSLRLLYGAQYSNQQVAFGSGFSDSLSQFNQFPGSEMHWHHLISLEAEGWF
jgi:hypothetical protein